MELTPSVNEKGYSAALWARGIAWAKLRRGELAVADWLAAWKARGDVKHEVRHSVRDDVSDAIVEVSSESVHQLPDIDMSEDSSGCRSGLESQIDDEPDLLSDQFQPAKRLRPTVNTGALDVAGIHGCSMLLCRA